MSPIDESNPYGPVHHNASDNATGGQHTLTRRMPLFLFLWMVVTVPLIYLVYVLNAPIYESSSILRIDPTRPELFGPSIRGEERGGIQPYLETQRNLILTDRVLDEALADQALTSFPLMRLSSSNDPKPELRKRLAVNIIPNTYLIRISYDSTDGNEAAAVVKAVVDAFMRQHRQFNLGDTESLKTHYEGYVGDQKTILERKKADLMKLAAEGQANQDKSDTRRQPSSTDALRATFLREEINAITGNIRQVEQKLEQLRFESSNQLVRVFLQDKASVPRSPRADGRLLYMALVPFVSLLALLCLFVSFDALKRRRASAA